MFRKFGILVVLTLAVMGVPGASAAPVVYNPVTEFYVQAPLNGHNIAVQSGANYWNYQTQDHLASAGWGASYNTGNSTLLTWTYNQVGNAIFTGPNALYSQWAYLDSSGTAVGSLVFDNGAGSLGLNWGNSSPTNWGWTATLLTWTAPTAGTVDVSYLASAISSDQAMGTGQTVFASLDLWNGTSVVNLAAQRGLVVDGSSSTFTATGVAVNAGDQIQFWRDGMANQQGTVLLDGTLTTLTFTGVPEPSTWALLAFSVTAVMVLRRRRTRA